MIKKIKVSSLVIILFSLAVILSFLLVGCISSLSMGGKYDKEQLSNIVKIIGIFAIIAIYLLGCLVVAFKLYYGVNSFKSETQFKILAILSLFFLNIYSGIILLKNKEKVFNQ